MPWRIRWRYKDERLNTYWATFEGPSSKRRAAEAFRKSNPSYAIVEMLPL